MQLLYSKQEKKLDPAFSFRNFYSSVISVYINLLGQ